MIRMDLRGLNLKYLLGGLAIVIASWLILQLPLFATFNTLVTDLLQGQTPARSEIVVVGIDDASLQQIGSWPWSRDQFAHALDKISESKPAVVAMDVLFLESRDGDTQFAQAIADAGFPVILASKLVDDQVLKSALSNYAGYVNFTNDPDGKIRTTKLYESVDGCNLSLSLATFASYLDVESPELCNSPLRLRQSVYQLAADNSLQFSYTREKFQYVSFGDLVAGRVPVDTFANKIVMIGSTALDLRSNLNDNFVDVFGQNIPGIYIHANIVNSFLSKSFVTPVAGWISTVVLVLATLLLSIAYLKIKQDVLDLGLLSAVAIFNVVIGLVLYAFGFVWPILPLTVLLVVHYVYALLYKKWSQTKENKYIKTAFSKYISPKLINQLLSNPDKLKLGGESRVMTVLFSDIRSFTTLSEGLSSAELIAMLNDYLHYMSDIIFKHDGTIDKYIGDAIMAFWNAPLDDSLHANNAVLAALEMQTKVSEFNAEFPQYPDIKIGIGLNSGEMTVGNVGGSQRFDYTVLGDNVNLGSRLEGLTKKYGVVVMVSEATRDLFSGEGVAFRLLDEVLVKGKNKPVKIYEPLLVSTGNSRILDVYHAGFAAYQQGDFTKALKALHEIGDDQPSHKLIERIESMGSAPDGWQGIWKWEEK